MQAMGETTPYRKHLDLKAVMARTDRHPMSQFPGAS